MCVCGSHTKWRSLGIVDHHCHCWQLINCLFFCRFFLLGLYRCRFFAFAEHLSIEFRVVDGSAIRAGRIIIIAPKDCFIWIISKILFYCHWQHLERFWHFSTCYWLGDSIVACYRVLDSLYALFVCHNLSHNNNNTIWLPLNGPAIVGTHKWSWLITFYDDMLW